MARKLKLRPLPRKEAIVGDGATERHYFDALISICQIRDISIKPDLPDTARKGQGQHNKVFNRARILLADGYDHVHCLIDYDTVIQEKKQTDFQTDHHSLLTEYPTGLTVYINNPCFETWLLLHYERTGRPFDSCSGVEAALSRYKHDYCKRTDYTKQLCEELYPQIQTAIANARFLEHNRDQYGEYYPRAQVHKLIQTLFLPASGKTE